MTGIHTLRPHQTRTGKKRVGRGNASGHGSYSGRGVKGQRARSGGQRGLKRRGLKQYLMQIPKIRGFKRDSEIVGINLQAITTAFKEGQHVTPDALVKKGLLPKGTKVKILGSGKLSKKISITAHAASKSAQEAITKAGGTLHLITRS